MIKPEIDKNTLNVYNIAAQDLTQEQKSIIKTHFQDAKIINFIELPDYLSKHIGKMRADENNLIVQIAEGVKRWAWYVNSRPKRKPIGIVIVEKGLPETALIIKELTAKFRTGPGFLAFYFDDQGFLVKDKL